MPKDDQIRQKAQDILYKNDRGGYTVPTARLYPFQWNWDSAFCAMGFACFDIDRALQELEMLYSGQWESGLVPHIVFHQEADSYFPGPQVWGTRHMRHTPPTSGISQPPVTATALAFIMNKNPTSAMRERARALYTKILRYHDWWARERDPDNRGLVAILHPWETGADNSPVWDAPLKAVPATQTLFERRDVTLVNPTMRPRQWEYERYIFLVELYRGLGWQGERLWAQTPFKVADVGLNAILMRDEQDLIQLAQIFEDAHNETILCARAQQRRQGFESLWSAERGLYLSRNLLTDTLIDIPSHASFLPLWGGAERAASLVPELSSWCNSVRYGLPTMSPQNSEFDAVRYWRGPVWGIVNWMIADGLKRHNAPDLAERLRQDTARLIETAGFWEYFNPLTGEGLGGGDFSWTAAVALAWAFDA